MTNSRYFCTHFVANQPIKTGFILEKNWTFIFNIKFHTKLFARLEFEFIAQIIFGNMCDKFNLSKLEKKVYVENNSPYFSRKRYL